MFSLIIIIDLNQCLHWSDSFVKLFFIRITDFTEEIHRLRPPRRFNKDGVIRPYIREEAEGYNLLLETDKGKYVDSDEYITHVKVKEDGKVVFIVTDK